MSMIHSLFNKRALMVGLLAGSSVLAASTFAMPGGGDGKAGCEAWRGQMVHTQRQAARADHLAGLKAKLKLQPEQEVAWQTFATTASSGKGSKGMENRRAMRDEFKQLNTPQRLDKMLARADQRHASMVKRAEATKQFYAQLSAEQQSVFDAEATFRHGKHRRHGGHRQQS